jgi:hypothetical protein
MDTGTEITKTIPMQNILSNTLMVDGQGNNDITGSWLGTSTWKYGRVYPDSKV